MGERVPLAAPRPDPAALGGVPGRGLAGNRWALATKTHHCMVDGVGSVDVAYVMLDDSSRLTSEAAPACNVEDVEGGTPAGSRPPSGLPRAGSSWLAAAPRRCVGPPPGPPSSRCDRVGALEIARISPHQAGRRCARRGRWSR